MPPVFSGSKRRELTSLIIEQHSRFRLQETFARLCFVHLRSYNGRIKPGACFQSNPTTVSDTQKQQESVRPTVCVKLLPRRVQRQFMLLLQRVVLSLDSMLVHCSPSRTSDFAKSDLHHLPRDSANLVRSPGLNYDLVQSACWMLLHCLYYPNLI